MLPSRSYQNNPPQLRTHLDIRETAERLGAKLKRISTTELAGPCLKCGGRDRFAVNTHRQIWNCRGCGVGGDAIALARHVLALNFAEALAFVGDERAEVDPRRPPHGRQQASAHEPVDSAADIDKTTHALALWRAAANPRGTLAERYLNFRGLALDDEIAGNAIRFHAGASALLVLFRSVMTGEPQAVSRTFLTPEGRKIGRKFIGPVGGAAIMFDAASSDLTVTEGVETAMTARALGMGPTWACGSAGAIARLPVIASVQRLRILVERDENGASEQAAVACAERWRCAGRQVAFKLPPPRCSDWNDAVRGDAR